MDESETWEFFKSYVVPLIFPAIGTLAVIGINEFLKARSSSRKINLDDILFLRNLAESTRELSVKYWCKDYDVPNEQKADEARITGALHGCSQIISSLKTIKKERRKELVYQLSVFRRTCTSGNFGSVGRSADADVLKDIEADGRAFEASVLACRWG